MLDATRRCADTPEKPLGAFILQDDFHAMEYSFV